MNRPSRDEYFLLKAFVASLRSKDPSTQVGAAIAFPDGTPGATGYNGLPMGLTDDPAILNDRDLKLRLTLHAESNAIDFSRCDLRGCTLYVYPIPPCAQCAARIAQAGITRVVSLIPRGTVAERWKTDWENARHIYQRKGIMLESADFNRMSCGSSKL